MSRITGQTSIFRDPALAVMGLLPARFSGDIVAERNPLSLSWRAAWLSILLGLAAVTAVYWETPVQMVHIWTVSASFNHGFLIFPICAYLIWIKRAALANMVPQPSVWGIGIIIGASLCWLVGSIASVSMVQQFAFVIVIQGLFLAVLGLKIGRVLMFPLGYMFFAVPFGKFMIAPLQDLTAIFVVKWLRMIDIPVYLDGIFISIPTGNFEVAEACSGVRFLIATIALGTLFAYITYRSRIRQAAFVALSIAVPIIANGFRAFGIVLIAYLSDNELAVGVDHIVYGWVFFAFITIVLLLVGMTFRDGDPDEPEIDADTVRKAGAAAVNQGRIFGATAIAVVLGVLAPLYAGQIAGRAIPAVTADFPVPAVGGGWQLAHETKADWSPVYPDAHLNFHRRYVKGPAQVDLHIAYYTSQRQGAELVSSRNSVSDEETWVRAASTHLATVVDGEDLNIYRTRMRKYGGNNRLAYQWYWIGGQFTSNPYFAKVLQAMAQLVSADEAAASIVISTYYEETPGDADRVLKDFLGNVQPLSSLLSGVSPH